jgi:hypothetical protein
MAISSPPARLPPHGGSKLKAALTSGARPGSREHAGAHGRQVGAERRPAAGARQLAEAAADRHQVDAVADQPLAAGDRATGGGAADHQVVLSGPAVEERGVGGEQRDVGRGAAACREALEVAPEGGVERRLEAPAAPVEERRPRPVGRRREDRSPVRELRAPVRLVGRHPLPPLGTLEPGGVVAILERRRQGRAQAGARRLVDRERLREQHGDRQAVGDEMVDRDRKPVLARREPQHRGAHQRPAREVERAAALRREPPLLDLAAPPGRAAGGVDERQRQRERGEHPLRLGRGQDGAQRLVAVDDLLQRAAQLDQVERPVEAQHAGLHVGHRRLRGELGDGEEIGLRLGERELERRAAREGAAGRRGRGDGSGGGLRPLGAARLDPAALLRVRA